MFSRAIVSTLYVLLVGRLTLAGTIYPCGEDLQVLRHATSCSKFVVCMHGQAVERSCRPGFHFDPAAQQCKPASEVNCTLETDPCPPYDDPSHMIIHPDIDFCNRFHVCYSGQKIEMSCASGLYWDRTNEFCTYPEEADCPTSINCPNLPGISYEPHPKRCDGYFICINGDLIEVATCSPPMIFDIHDRNCNTPELAQCIRDPCIGTQGQISIQDPEDCRVVVLCQYGREINRITCPPGQISDDYGTCQPGDPETCEIFV
ncbi:peritrophin-1-like [Lutzomyia longipalpis]|uniref:peritrophin-1-like n=1 Tax=Lutzomyia longipalpis TaxID=7200 RepID=UPI00248449D2|nr:peritrophin-1-like [Lutzomyia longipalpis]